MNARQQKVTDLKALVLDEEAPDSERLSAAIQAMRIIDKYDLLQIGPSANGPNLVDQMKRVVDAAPEISEGAKRVAAATTSLADSVRQVLKAAGGLKVQEEPPRRRRYRR